jgi:7-carboxy-7-deazaguanine synthase (Cx14CxxC type)
MYAVKEIFKTLQGEGGQAGRTAVFCRFTGCNLWSGREEDRHTATCQFCDTDFVGMDGENGGRYATAITLVDMIERVWGDDRKRRFVVCTGGEPLLQLDPALIEELHRRDFYIAVETNGTIAAPAGLDWICVSPKAGTDLVQRRGDELKLIFPQQDTDPQSFAALDFRQFWLQAMDGPNLQTNLQGAIAYCLEHPAWRLSLQTHKMLGIP